MKYPLIDSTEGWAAGGDRCPVRVFKHAKRPTPSGLGFCFRTSLQGLVQQGLSASSQPDGARHLHHRFSTAATLAPFFLSSPSQRRLHLHQDTKKHEVPLPLRPRWILSALSGHLPCTHDRRRPFRPNREPPGRRPLFLQPVSVFTRHFAKMMLP